MKKMYDQLLLFIATVAMLYVGATIVLYAAIKYIGIIALILGIAAAGYIIIRIVRARLARRSYF